MSEKINNQNLEENKNAMTYYQYYVTCFKNSKDNPEENVVDSAVILLTYIIDSKEKITMLEDYLKDYYNADKVLVLGFSQLAPAMVSFDTENNQKQVEDNDNIKEEG